MDNWTRRTFLQTAAAAAGAVFAKDLLALDALAPVSDPLGAYPYRGWEVLYKDWWDTLKGRIDPETLNRTTHGINCTGSCTWKGYVANGILVKEEQYADYPVISADLPTYNPRGCQKGANYKEYVYGPQRVKYPLIRAGARGEGKWRRATWDEALGLIASHVVKAIQTGGAPGQPGADTVTFFAAIPAKHHLTLAGGFRVANLIGGVVCSFYDWYCDLPPGEPLTWGVQTDACESADWYNSRLIVLWGANTTETRIPDAHYIHEAQKTGTRVVAIFPEYNGASVHADEFVAVNPGTDGALALAMANVIVNNRLYDAPYIKQFTDMPMLVRTDTRKFLRASDLDPAASPNALYFWDLNSKQAVLAPGTLGSAQRTLDLGSFNPALEGSFKVKIGGFFVTVRPVFEFLKQKLAAYTPAAVAPTTGVGADTITRLAKEFAAARNPATGKPAARIIEGAGTNHYYHNDLINRAQILLVALTGNVGVPGGGFDHYVGQEKLWAEHGFFDLAFPLGRPKQRFQNTTLWTYVHAGVKSDVDGLWPRPIAQYIRDSVANGWMPLWPRGTLDSGRSPKVLFIWGANYLNQAKGFLDVYNTLWPKLDLIVDVNFRMDTSALYADVVLPAASWYEQWNLSTTDLHTYVHPFTPVIGTQFEARTDWQIWRGLAKALQDTGYAFTDTAPDGTVINRNFSTLVKQFDAAVHTPTPADGFFPDPGPVDVSADRHAAQFLLDGSPETAGLTIMNSVADASIIKHPQRFLKTNEEWTSDLKPGVAYYGFQRMTEHLRPLTTLAGRQQFYIDHEWYLERDPSGMSEELPVFKPVVNADQYPLRWITPHGRWSIHSTWRDAKYQLRLQRGRPVVYLNPAEAAARKLADNDLVEVFNGHGNVKAHLYLSPRLPEGMAMMYHGWERYFLGNGWQSPCTIRIKPTQLIGRYAHINFRLNYWGPTGNQKDTLVEVRKATGPL